MGSRILDKHFEFLEEIREAYKKRNLAPKYLEQAIKACEKQIAISKKAAKAFRREWKDDILPSHTGFKQLSIIREKQMQFDEALRLVIAAKSQDWSGDWDRRIARLEKKLAKKSSTKKKPRPKTQRSKNVPPEKSEQQKGLVSEPGRTDSEREVVTCLCGARLGVRQDKLGRIARCLQCRESVHLVPSKNESGSYEFIKIKAEKVSIRGKARWRMADGSEGFVEEITLESFRKRGWKGLFSENDLWWVLMSLLCWDIIFARLDGVWSKQFEDFPSEFEDMPHDLFKKEFYGRRAVIADQRLNELAHVDIARELRNSFSKNFGRRCRPIEDWNKYSIESLCSVVSAVPQKVVCEILRRLLTHFNEHRRGMPDLLLWNKRGVAFAEVKGGRDRLSDTQHEWINFLHGIGVRVFLVHVSGS